MKAIVKKITEALMLMSIGEFSYMNRLAPGLDYVPQAPSFCFKKYYILEKGVILCNHEKIE